MASVDLVKQGADRLSIAGLTGATAPSRYVGATASGAPASGTFLTGDWIIDQSGSIFICTAGGSPGSWGEVSGGGGGSVAAFTEADTEAELTTAAAAGGHIMLTANITLTAALTLAVADTVLDLNGFTISGSGLDLDAVSGDPGMVTLTADRVTVRNGVVDGSGNTSTTGVKIKGGNYCLVDKIKATGMVSTSTQSGYGFWISGTSDHNVVRSCQAHSCGYSGFDVALDNIGSGTHQPEGNAFLDCRAFSCTQDGFDIFQTTGTKVIGCHAESCARGVRVTGGTSTYPNTHITISGGQFTSNTEGIQIRDVVDHAVISNNIANANSSRGIYLLYTATYLRNVAITGNVVEGNGSTGILVSSSASNVAITGNVVEGNLYGVWLNGEAHLVSGNLVSANSRDGIVVSACNNSSIVNNELKGNSQETHNTYSGILVTNSNGAANYNNLQGNRSHLGAASPQQKHGISVTSGNTQNFVCNNDLLFGGSTSALSDAGTSTATTAGNRVA